MSKLYVFEVSASKSKVIGQVSVIHSNSQDAAFAAIRQVRKDQSIPEGVALFATQKVQSATPAIGDSLEVK